MDSNMDFWRSSRHSEAFFQELGAELVFTQDISGQYLSFYWQKAEQYNLTKAQIVDRRAIDTLQPLPPAPYFDRLRRAIETLEPERFSYPFGQAEKYFLFDLTVAPIVASNGQAVKVLAIGRLLSDKPTDWPRYFQEPYCSMLGLELRAADRPGWIQTLAKQTGIPTLYRFG
ncbi:MAG: hypothetical protein U7126_04445 [Microcoleus sp.]